GRVSGTAAGLGKAFVRSCVVVAADAMLFVVDGSLLAVLFARRGLRERSCQRLTALASGAAALAAAPAIACRSVLAAQAIPWPDSRAQLGAVAAGAGAKKRDEPAPAIHPTPSATASAPVTSAGCSHGAPANAADISNASRRGALMS